MLIINVCGCEDMFAIIGALIFHMLQFSCCAFSITETWPLKRWIQICLEFCNIQATAFELVREQLQIWILSVGDLQWTSDPWKSLFFSPPISMRSAFLCYSRASLEMCLGLVFFYFWTALQRGFVGLTTLCFYVVYPSEATGICFSRDLLSHQHLLWLHKNWLLYTNPWMHRKENKLSP